MKLFVLLLSMLMIQAPALAQTPVSADGADIAGAGEIEELDPFAPDVEETLERFDRVYEEETGMSPWLRDDSFRKANDCSRRSCKVWIVISKASQSAQLYLDGMYRAGWAVSSGLPGFETPDFDRHPNGRIYDRYTSTKYPEGDYAGLGNMPYAVFIQGGFALHGTPQGNWSRLGRKASHGCVRMHPDNARYFNRLVRSVGIRNVWITIY